MHRLLLAILILSSPLLSQTKPQPHQDYSFRVKADRLWTDTGLDLHPHDRIHITGAVTTCQSLGPNEKQHLILSSAPVGALLATLHPEGKPLSASTDLDVPIIDPSHLYLGINGWQCNDIVPVKVHVDRAPMPAPK